MRITQSQDAKWYIVDICEDDPKPEVQLLPVSSQDRLVIQELATEFKMLPIPAKGKTTRNRARGFQPYERVAPQKVFQLYAHKAIVGLKNFEDADGLPLQAAPDGLECKSHAFERAIDYLIGHAPGEFTAWLFELILEISDTADALTKKRQEESAKNS